MKTKAKIGVIHGRFQLLHLGHIEYLLEGKSRCDFLYIGIANPDNILTKVEKTNENRSEIWANPFTYYERLHMIKDAMIENGINERDFAIVPFPINYPERLEHYVPLNGVFYVTIYDEWGEHKLKVLTDMGLKTEVMWRRDLNQRLTTGTEARKLIVEDKKWEHLVPVSVVNYIKENNLISRLKKVCVK
jgi:cytidyltransferase-like protein